MRHGTQARFARWAACRLRLRAAHLAVVYARRLLLAGLAGRRRSKKHSRESPKMRKSQEPR
jgi:hypothetical protein